MHRIMVIAGEVSGDSLAGELVEALQGLQQSRGASVPALHFFGAGGPKMAAAGVELLEDLTEHAVVGLWEVIRRYRFYRAVFHRLLAAAVERRPDVIVCVDFSGFNRRFAAAIRRAAARLPGAPWHPRLVQYVSPQVWASRPKRAERMAEVFDLLLAIFPFEQAWYAERVPQFAVKFVGHPMLDRFGQAADTERVAAKALAKPNNLAAGSTYRGVLLPGSRVAELRRHLPVMLAAAGVLARDLAVTWRMILPNEKLGGQARAATTAAGLNVTVEVGGLGPALSEADVAIASTGTVTMECAYFGVPTVAIYKTSWSTYQFGRRLIRVPYLAMPNLLARAEVLPELIQNAAQPEAVAAAARRLLLDQAERDRVQSQLRAVRASLGEPGASRRAAEAIFARWLCPAVGETQA